MQVVLVMVCEYLADRNDYEKEAEESNIRISKYYTNVETLLVAKTSKCCHLRLTTRY